MKQDYQKEKIKKINKSQNKKLKVEILLTEK